MRESVSYDEFGDDGVSETQSFDESIGFELHPTKPQEYREYNEIGVGSSVRKAAGNSATGSNLSKLMQSLPATAATMVVAVVLLFVYIPEALVDDAPPEVSDVDAYFQGIYTTDSYIDFSVMVRDHDPSMDLTIRVEGEGFNKTIPISSHITYSHIPDLISDKDYTLRIMEGDIEIAESTVRTVMNNDPVMLVTGFQPDNVDPYALIATINLYNHQDVNRRYFATLTDLNGASTFESTFESSSDVDDGSRSATVHMIEELEVPLSGEEGVLEIAWTESNETHESDPTVVFRETLPITHDPVSDIDAYFQGIYVTEHSLDLSVMVRDYDPSMELSILIENDDYSNIVPISSHITYSHVPDLLPNEEYTIRVLDRHVKVCETVISTVQTTEPVMLVTGFRADADDPYSMVTSIKLFNHDDVDLTYVVKLTDANGSSTSVSRFVADPDIDEWTMTATVHMIEGLDTPLSGEMGVLEISTLEPNVSYDVAHTVVFSETLPITHDPVSDIDAYFQGIHTTESSLELSVMVRDYDPSMDLTLEVEGDGFSDSIPIASHITHVNLPDLMAGNDYTLRIMDGYVKVTESVASTVVNSEPVMLVTGFQASDDDPYLMEATIRLFNHEGLNRSYVATLTDLNGASTMAARFVAVSETDTATMVASMHMIEGLNVPLSGELGVLEIAWTESGGTTESDPTVVFSETLPITHDPVSDIDAYFQGFYTTETTIDLTVVVRNYDPNANLSIQVSGPSYAQTFAVDSNITNVSITDLTANQEYAITLMDGYVKVIEDTVTTVQTEGTVALLYGFEASATDPYEMALSLKHFSDTEDAPEYEAQITDENGSTTGYSSLFVGQTPSVYETTLYISEGTDGPLTGDSGTLEIRRVDSTQPDGYVIVFTDTFPITGYVENNQ